jgi:hypothetical protein
MAKLGPASTNCEFKFHFEFKPSTKLSQFIVIIQGAKATPTSKYYRITSLLITFRTLAMYSIVLFIYFMNGICARNNESQTKLLLQICNRLNLWYCVKSKRAVYL